MIKFPPEKIMVPMNLSDTAMTAWRQALDLARVFGSKIEAIYVHEWGPAELGMITGESVVPPNLDAEVSRLIQERIGADVPLHYLSGFTEQTVTSWAQHHRFDLLVIGTHSRSGLNRVLMGSMAEAIVRHSSVPVLVSRVLVNHWNRVLAPVNQRPYSFDGLLAAAKVAAAMHLPLTVLHVIEEPVFGGPSGLAGAKTDVQRLIDCLPADLRRSCRPEVDIRFGDPPTEIASAAGARGFIVLTAHPRRYLGERIVGTITERVLRHSPQSVLAIPTSAVRARPPAVTRREHAPA